MSEQVINQALVSELVETWSGKTVDQEEDRLRIPLKTLQVEVLQVARLVENHWEDRTVKGKLRRGLSSVAGLGTISPSTAGEIRELQLCVSEVQARYDQLLEDTANVPVQRGNELLSEFRAALSFLLEDGKHEQGAAQLAQLREIHDVPRSMESLAMALEGFAELAETHQDELGRMQIFSLAIIDEALQVARDLRERTIQRKSGDLVTAQRETMALRNRLLGALMERVTTARRAIRYVFRDDPALLEQAGSDYERSRRSNGDDHESEETSSSDVAADAPASIATASGAEPAVAAG
jgi:hypothetical protein